MIRSAKVNKDTVKQYQINCKYTEMLYVATVNVTGPAKIKQVGANYTKLYFC